MASDDEREMKTGRGGRSKRSYGLADAAPRSQKRNGYRRTDDRAGAASKLSSSGKHGVP
jgi:hypothetical protein